MVPSFRGENANPGIYDMFYGEIEDLDAEKLIYGKDFAYIHSIDRFSEIVGLYLKRQINNMIN